MTPCPGTPSRPVEGRGPWELLLGRVPVRGCGAEGSGCHPRRSPRKQTPVIRGDQWPRRPGWLPEDAALGLARGAGAGVGEDGLAPAPSHSLPHILLPYSRRV